jgi:peptidyl-prolyl cis-trans isomerase C
MMRKIAPFFLVALPLFAQQADKPVAVVNGQTITAKALDQMWDRIGPQMRDQYEKSGGGKAAFLNQYVNKMLIVQEAMKSGFDKRADVQNDVAAAREAAIFDDYVRDVVSADLVKEIDERAYYDQHRQDFVTPERLHIRHIVITDPSTGPRAKSKDEAIATLNKISAPLKNVSPQTMPSQFAALAKQYSEDAAAQSGGDLGWVVKGRLDPTFEAAAWSLPVDVPSGVVQTQFGYHLILVEARQPAGVKPFEEVQPAIHEALLAQKMADVMQILGRLTVDLRANSKVAVYPENIK